MAKKLIEFYTKFIHQNPESPLINRLEHDITQMQSDEVKNLPKDQQSIFCISLLWLTRDFLARNTLSTSALGTHIDRTLKALTRRFSKDQLITLQTEYREWRKQEEPHACPTSIIR